MKKGFTLVEILVVVSIISVLSTLGTVVARKAISMSKATTEINAARHLTSIYLIAAEDNHGNLPPGIDPDATVTDNRGNTWPGYVAKRYPIRLGEALDWHFSGSVCVNEAEKWADDTYSASVYPTFGINATFVGGSFREPEPDPDRDADQYGHFCIQRLAQADNPSRQILFVSARSYSGHGEAKAGNFYVRSPYLKGRRWSGKFDPKQPSLKWGNVDPRHGGKAVASFLDGTARLLDKTQLQDMRYWAKGARLADDPHWSIVSK